LVGIGDGDKGHLISVNRRLNFRNYYVFRKVYQSACVMTSIEVRKTAALTGHRDCVYALAPAGDAHTFFSAAGDGMVVQWDLRKPEEGELIAKLPNSIYALCSLPERGALVVAHNYQGVHLIDWKEKRELASLQLTAAAIFDLLVIGNDLWVATGEGAVLVVDLPAWRVKARLAHSEKNARTLAHHAARGEVAVGYSDHCIRVYDAQTYELKKQWKAHENSVFTVRYSPDQQYLLSGSRDARLKAWRVDDYALHQEVVAHLFAINHLDFSPDGKHFVTCSMDKSIKVWRTFDLTLLKVIDKARHTGHGTSVNKLLWTSFNNQLVSASDDRSLAVWELFFKLQPTATQS
jgi:WD40 repeat protein